MKLSFVLIDDIPKMEYEFPSGKMYLTSLNFLELRPS